MTFVKRTTFSACKYLAIAALLAYSASAMSDSLPPLVDDFSDASANNLGFPRQFISDSVAGGATRVDHNMTDGVLTVSGNIAPPRGQLGWASCVLLLDAQGQARNVTEFEGVALRIKMTEGSLSLSVNSTEVANFDYHAAPLQVPADGAFHEIKLPFSQFKRAWSAQTPLNTATINGLSLVAYSPQPAAFRYQVDEVRFY